MPPPDEPRQGDVIAGCVVERLLGRGAMGSAHLARRAADGRPVVVKVLAAELAQDAELRARFVREWQALRKVERHPNVVEVLDLDEGAARPALVLEHVPGVSLDEALRRHGRIEWARAARVARDLALGLAAVHARGIVHRDVKPANAVVTPAGQAKLIDFGVAKDLARHTALTLPGELLGTASFMAPEVWEEGPTTPAVDLFALGATLYHLVAGAPPFAGDDLDQVADKVLAGDHAPLRAAVPAAPADLEALVEHLLEPEPAHRCRSAAACARDLDRVLAGQPPLLPTLLVEGAAARLPLVGAEWFTLGRDPAARLALGDPSVAPKHAQVRRAADGRFLLFDLRGSTGTWLDDAPLAPGEPRPLRDGARGRVGGVGLRFRDPR
ncbi:MAG: protein kinase [Planctomycetes bacterium]|nr:protein kinase [Planctomycetota bacterium]